MADPVNKRTWKHPKPARIRLCMIFWFRFISVLKGPQAQTQNSTRRFYYFCSPHLPANYEDVPNAPVPDVIDKTSSPDLAREKLKRIRPTGLGNQAGL